LKTLISDLFHKGITGVLNEADLEKELAHFKITVDELKEIAKVKNLKDINIKDALTSIQDQIKHDQELAKKIRDLEEELIKILYKKSTSGIVLTDPKKTPDVKNYISKIQSDSWTWKDIIFSKTSPFVLSVLGIIVTGSVLPFSPYSAVISGAFALFCSTCYSTAKNAQIDSEIKEIRKEVIEYLRVHKPDFLDNPLTILLVLNYIATAPTLIFLSVGAYFAYQDKSKITAAICAALATNPLVLHPFIARQFRQHLNQLEKITVAINQYRTDVKDDGMKDQLEQSETNAAQKAKEVNAIRQQLVKTSGQLLAADTSYCEILQQLVNDKDTIQRLSGELAQSKANEQQLLAQLQNRNDEKKQGTIQTHQQPIAAAAPPVPKGGIVSKEAIPKQPLNTESISPASASLPGDIRTGTQLQM
jgi:hypothetical protein